jgi:hypothetical protein
MKHVQGDQPASHLWRAPILGERLYERMARGQRHGGSMQPLHQDAALHKQVHMMSNGEQPAACMHAQRF